MNKAFSLIEVLIVITVVAILAAIAIPAYQNYRQRVQATKLSTIAQTLSNQATLYANSHNGFPTARQLGLPEDPQNPGNDLFADPAAVSPDVVLVQIGDIGGGCGSDLRIALYLNPDESVTGGDVFVLSYDLFHIKGTLVPFCQYVYNVTPGGPYVDGDLLPNCVNAFDGSLTAWMQLQAQSSCQ